jgi:glutathione S-transferase
LPQTPIQRLFALLIEIWADEFWHATAEHYRFSFPENFPIWRDELASLLPGVPRFLKHAVVRHYYKYMLAITRDVGVEAEKFGLIEQWSERQLDAMDHHFESMPFLLGTRASIADFALMGPINGHLAWDPRTIGVLIEPRPHLRAWIDRMSVARADAGSFIDDDHIPETLQPLMHSVMRELPAYLDRCAAFVRSEIPRVDTCYPRFGPMVDVPYGGGTLRRIVVPYTAWMLQRMLDQFRALPTDDAGRVAAWLRAHGAERVLTQQFPRVRRVGLHIAPEIELREPVVTEETLSLRPSALPNCALGR